MAPRPGQDGPAPVLSFETLDSTNAEARRRAEAGEGGPLWITAAVQTAGRGRRGRTWSTDPGNLAASLLLTIDRPAAAAAQLSFVAALAVADVAGTYAPPQAVRLKWPNDVTIHGLKVAGILLESGLLPAAPAGERRLWLAIGVGINLASAPAGAEKPAAPLADFMSRPAPGPAEVLDALARRFAYWMDLWTDGGFAPIQSAWLAGAQGMGERCLARLDTETIEGIAEGLEPDGALRMRLPDGSVRRISAGDVFFGEGR